MTEPVLGITDLRVGIAGSRDIVNGVSFAIRGGETLCLVGESGSGKSMIANAVMGLLPARSLVVTGGDIRFSGENLICASARRMRDLRGRRIGMIFQDPMSALNPVRRIESQFEEVFAAHNVVPPEGRGPRMRDLLDRMHLPNPTRILRSYPFELSGGQRQRVMIAMALALNPALLIADEPTTALDVTTQAQILHLIAELRRETGTAVLFITHDFGVVAEIADRVVVLRQGRAVEQGALSAVLRAPADAYTKMLIAAIPAWHPGAAVPPAAPLVAAASLHKAFRGSPAALSDVSVAIGEGETVGIVGESGSGKSTLAKCLIGIEEADRGAITIAGTDILRLPKRQRRPHRHLMQMVFQDPTAALNPRHSVARTLRDVIRANGAAADRIDGAIDALLDDVKLDRGLATRLPHQLSGGQRQRVCLARALAANPRILIADEALSALDVSVQRQILDLFGELKLRRRLGILFITHDLRVAAEFCDRLIVMRHGAVMTQGAPAAVLAGNRHPYVETLLDAIPGQDWFPLDGRADAPSAQASTPL